MQQINPYTTFQKLFQPQQQAHHQQAKQILQKSAQQIQKELEEERLFNEIRRESALAQQIKSTHTEEQINAIVNMFPDMPSQRLPKPSKFNDPNLTDSITSVVTDFSPPKDWIE